MTHKEEAFMLDVIEELQDSIRSPTIRQLIRETHENNLMLRSIIKAINTYISHHPQENRNDFIMNVVANLISSGIDINTFVKHGNR